jgi:hypothetical protein
LIWCFVKATSSLACRNYSAGHQYPKKTKLV